MSVGNYNAETFNTELLAKLNASAFGTAHVFTRTSYNTVYGKETITNTNADFSITSNDYNYGSLGQDKSVTTTSTSNVWTSPNVLNFAGTSYIDILTDLPIASTNSATQNGNVLQRVSYNIYII